MRRAGTAISALVGVCAAILPASAAASTAYTTVNPVDGRLTIHYEAAPGEVNDLGIVRQISDDSMPDASATAIDLLEFDLLTINTRPECRPAFGSTTPTFAARCPVPTISPTLSTILMELGEGDDRIRGYTSDIGWAVEGGYGDDDLRSADGTDNLLGGPDDDALRAGRGDDGSHGQQGEDNIIDLHGGARLNRNNISGGLGSDTITDGTADSFITGDVVNREGAGGSHDRIYDEGGADRIKAGPGNDRINVRDGVREQSIDCGDGRDDEVILDNRDPSNLFRAGCEHIIIPRGGG